MKLVKLDVTDWTRWKFFGLDEIDWTRWKND